MMDASASASASGAWPAQAPAGAPNCEAEQQGQRDLLRRLRAGWEGRGCRVQVFETHISWIYVVDQLAYKFKKAMRFDVLDYSTLAARRHCCLEELRLNRRLAPTLYLGLSAVTGSVARPELDGRGALLEPAVRMRAFPQETLWSARLSAGLLGGAEVDALALRLARFHADAELAAPDTPWGGAATLDRLGRADLAALAGLPGGRAVRAQLARVARWHDAQMAAPARFALRRAQGRVRACHGDLHSGNILTLEGRVEIFDGIEFNDALRWIDVISDLAFIIMDLRFHGRGDLAARLLRGYLGASDDYQGLAVLRYYLVMRALVRCKVCLLGARAPAPARPSQQLAQARRYLALAVRGLARRGALVLMHGLSGCGKSYCAGRLADPLEALWIRSDVERKHLHGVAATTSMAAPARQGIYDAASDAATYARLLQLARAGLGAGVSVIVDAACLRRGQRRPFQTLARELGAPYFIVDLRADEAVLRERLERRASGAPDASDAQVSLLAYQRAALEPLTPAERRHALALDGGASALDRRLAALAGTIRAAAPPS
ncbi:AAA family ATPase [Oxalobacteraceae bacterium]|nr:AAA family ATPase [Oxalobacteraceae bacterium]